jgi:hypothetical protein
VDHQAQAVQVRAVHHQVHQALIHILKKVVVGIFMILEDLN